jgi:hypothetical protein
MNTSVYHGTSTLFEKSIRIHGLGGRDPMQDLQALDFYQALLSLCQEHLRGAEGWTIFWSFADDIAAQATRFGNWRYGSVYVTPSKTRALNHSYGRFGSELLGIISTMVQGLRDIDTKLLLPFKGEPVMAMLKRRPRPLLIELPLPDLSQLEGENGSDPAVTMQRWREYEDMGLSLSQDRVSVPIGFKLLRPVPASRLTFHYPVPPT